MVRERYGIHEKGARSTFPLIGPLLRGREDSNP